MDERSDHRDRNDAIIHPAPAGGPSLRIVAVSEPDSEAAAYAQRLGADVGVDRSAVLHAIEQRLEAVRALRDEPADDDADDLLARASGIRAAAVAPDVGEADLVRLQLLADELARAGRIRAHTERRFEERRATSRRGRGPVATPEVVLEAASVVVDAEAALHRAEEALTAATLPPLPFDADGPADLTAGARPTGLLARLRETIGGPRTDDQSAAGGGDRTGPPDEQLLAARDAAEAQVRLAWEQWRRVAGADADPRAPEAVLTSHPQLPYDQVDEPDPATSPTLLAVAAFHRKVQARWRVMWASVGGGEPPEPEQLEVALEGLAGRRRRAASDVVRLDRAERRAAAAAALARPLVVVQPGRWTTAEELRRIVAPLPPEAQVIVLERRGPGPFS